MFVFDMDGTLIDSEHIIRESYREAGVEPPDDFMSLGHHSWLDGSANIHGRKNQAYLRRLREHPARLLPPFHTAVWLKQAGCEVALLTGAPKGAASVLSVVTPTWPWKIAQDGLSPEEKRAWLGMRPGGVYVDDQTYVQMPEGWGFVHYTGQSAGELFTEVTDVCSTVRRRSI